MHLQDIDEIFFHKHRTCIHMVIVYDQTPYCIVIIESNCKYSNRIVTIDQNFIYLKFFRTLSILHYFPMNCSIGNDWNAHYVHKIANFTKWNYNKRWKHCTVVKFHLIRTNWIILNCIYFQLVRTTIHGIIEKKIVSIGAKQNWMQFQF